METWLQLYQTTSGYIQRAAILALSPSSVSKRGNLLSLAGQNTRHSRYADLQSGPLFKETSERVAAVRLHRRMHALWSSRHALRWPI